jgi:hypothetical protein
MPGYLIEGVKYGPTKLIKTHVQGFCQKNINGGGLKNLRFTPSLNRESSDFFVQTAASSLSEQLRQ